MERIKQRWQSRPYKVWRVIAILLLIYLLTIRTWAWVTINNNNKHTASNDFNHVAHDDASLLSNQFEVYANILYSGRALFLTNNSVSRQDWNNFVDAQDISQRYPGIYTISYISSISRSDVGTFTDQLNASRLPSETSPVTIYPSSNNNQLAVVTYVAPGNIPQTPIGYDLMTSKTRAQMLTAARDTGLPSASLPLTLLSDTSKKASDILLAIPIYKGSDPVVTVAERQAALEGYVALGLQAQPMLDSIFKADTPYGNIAITVSSNNQIIYKLGSVGAGQMLHRTMLLYLAGQTWQLDFSAPTDFGLGSTAKLAPAALLLSTVPFVIIIGFMVYYGLRLRELRDHHRNYIMGKLDKEKHQDDN